MKEERRSYPLPTETLPFLDLAYHVADIAELRTFLQGRGIETTNTRIERYHKYLELARTSGPQCVDSSRIFKNSVGDPFRSPADWFLYVLREVHELMWILRGLKVRLPVGVDDKLKTIVSGRDFAALDTDSTSRNAQFELRIASYFCQAGCNVDLSTDTDIIALTNDHAFYLECKRVGSESQLGKRLSEARTQLRRRMPRKDGRRLVLGCVAVDVTKVAFSHNGLTFGMTNDHSRDVIQEKLVGIAADADRLLSFDSCRKLLNYWLQIHIAALILKPSPPRFASRFSNYQIPRPMLNTRERRVLGAFYSYFESASSDPRQSPTRRLTVRTMYNFPAGTTFYLDHKHLLESMGRKELADGQEKEVVCRVTLNGRTDEFALAEVAMLPNEVIEEWRRVVVENPGSANAFLMACLYSERYPYEEPQDSP